MPCCRSLARLGCALVTSALAVPALAQSLPSQAVVLAQLAVEEEMLLAVQLNGVPAGEATLLLRTPDGRFHASVQTLLAWRLRVPAVPMRERGGTAWLPLDAIPGLTARFDGSRQQLSLIVPPEAFEASRVEAARSVLPRVSTATPGGFANYSLVGTRVSGTSSYAAQLEAGVFGPQGVLVAGVLAQRNDLDRGVTRLDTTYTRDYPARLASLRVGDATSASGAWGRSLRIGGVQWASNFALQPGFVAFPTFTARGESALPSTVDVFVNNALVAQQSVPQGPFSITNIPTVTGAGDVQLVVRDLLGREVLISQPFYASSDLLAPGLSQYSFEVGAEREDFGVESFGYGRAVASATWRHGLTASLTGEVRGEATKDHVAAGGAVDWLAGRLGTLSATAALSEARAAGAGWLAGVAYSYQAAEASMTMRARWTSPDWRQAGTTELSPVPRSEIAASASARLGRFGSLNAAYVDQRFRTRRDNEFASLGWSAPIAYGASLAIIGLRNFGERTTTLSAIVTLPFGTRDTASVAWLRQRGGGSDDDVQLTVQRALPIGEGFGYRLFARSERDVQAGVAYQGPVGTYTAEATRFAGSTGVRLAVAGGVGVIGGHTFASREITESFGVVKVDDYDDVSVLLENQPAARTRRGGYAVLPRLRAYDINRIGIVQQDLPLDAAIDALSIEAVPAFRSGMLIEFPVRRARGATLVIVWPDGTPIPAGAVAMLDGGERVFPVAEGGMTYLEGLAASNRVVVQHGERRCAFAVAYPPSRDPLPDLGRFVCTPEGGPR